VYKRKNGTSFATPFVAGAAAVYKQAYGGGPGKIRSMLLEDARTSYPGRGGDHPERLLVFRDPTGAAGCGDGQCLGDEGHENCAVDCGCEARGCDDVSPVGCYCDPACVEEKDCCSDAATYCPAE
ncbi:MAG TPA: S8 family serine peptidase, partial [Kofleriaceae bacterium]|nr:S8 family serine peptidase [Kofleriaceae bacterium]